MLINYEIKESQQKNLLISSGYNSPFQSFEFLEFINLNDRYHADIFAIEDDNGVLVCSMLICLQKEEGLKAFFSKRAIVYGGPIILENHEEVRKGLALLLKETKKYYNRKAIYLEIRNSLSYEKYSSIFNTEGWSFLEHLNVQLDLKEKSLNDVLSNMSYNRRREIKLSFKQNAKVNESTDENEIHQFYKLLKNLYTTRVKLPLPSESYFQNMSKTSIGKVFIVSHESNIIGGAFTFVDNKSGIYTMYYAGNRNYHKKIFPTHLAIIGAIEFAIANKYKMMDFMGAGKPGVKYGVRDFKLQFGGDLVEHGRFINILNPLMYNIGKVGLKILSKIK
jgi:serine/alanine adding enzyme